MVNFRTSHTVSDMSARSPFDKTEHDGIDPVVPVHREAAEMLMRVLEALPERGGNDTATRRRVEGAVIALEGVSIARDGLSNCDGNDAP